MRPIRRCTVAVLALASAPAFGGEVGNAEAPKTTASVTGFYYAMRDQPDFGVGVATLDRGAFHLEARYNYEARNATSVFAGWTFAGGDALSFEVTPIIGGLYGGAHGVVPGFEASLAYKSLDFYIEAEYVHDLDDSSASYYYAWSELGWKPASWLRLGLVGQRTKVVDTGRELQRGVFAQLVGDKVTLGIYGFNPDSGSRYLIVSLGVQF